VKANITVDIILFVVLLVPVVLLRNKRVVEGLSHRGKLFNWMAKLVGKAETTLAARIVIYVIEWFVEWGRLLFLLLNGLLVLAVFGAAVLAAAFVAYEVVSHLSSRHHSKYWITEGHHCFLGWLSWHARRIAEVVRELGFGATVLIAVLAVGVAMSSVLGRIPFPETDDETDETASELNSERGEPT
jgi:hypothetical protein